MIPNLTTGEIPLLIDSPKTKKLDELEGWQIDALLSSCTERESRNLGENTCLSLADEISSLWMENLTSDQWEKIKKRRSLYGVPIPKQWIEVWRIIIKEPALRDPWGSTKSGSSVGHFSHLWNIWAQETFEEHCDDMDKEIIRLSDCGFLHEEIGILMKKKYGDLFWAPKKDNTTTTPRQVVRNDLYWRIPNKIARAELYDICRKKIEKGLQ